MRKQAQRGCPLPKVTELMSDKAGLWQSGSTTLALGLRVWPQSCTWCKVFTFDFRGSHSRSPSTIKGFQQLISFIQPEGQGVPRTMEWSGIPKHKQKKLCPSSKGRDNFLYSQKKEKKEKYVWWLKQQSVEAQRPGCLVKPFITFSVVGRSFLLI